SNGTAGGPRHGGIYGVILWSVCQGLNCRALHDPFRANADGSGRWLGGGRWRAADDHDLSMAHGGDGREALLMFLSVSGRGAVPPALAGGGAAHPLGGAGGAGRSSDRTDRRGFDSEEGRAAD